MRIQFKKYVGHLRFHLQICYIEKKMYYLFKDLSQLFIFCNLQLKIPLTQNNVNYINILFSISILIKASLKNLTDNTPKSPSKLSEHQLTQIIPST